MNRRGFLTATAATPLLVVPFAGAAAGASVELVTLADTAFAADKVHILALNERDQAKVRMIALIGDPPPLARWHGAVDRRLDIGGQPDMFDYAGFRFELFDRSSDGVERRRWVIDAARTQHLRTHERLIRGDTSSAEYLSTRVSAAIAYEVKKVEALKRSGLEAAEHEVSRTEYIAQRAARAVIDFRIETLSELTLKVRAWEALKRADHYGGNLNSATIVVMADALRICGTSSDRSVLSIH
ncbi:hypothetical protein [Chenggangzhangella methanolivorans]|uniref:Uncharacterized protein n=1 Tax=Chenggangzhangella methanolivorans TaxID=1437009 RepID=A0A9E6R779_9HYPH|nr:hypothetical protein [Chenggangzhangella methanolivorans]QZN98559.1 hypothetical protein K6K41_16105 [Chenggangzhangella methanolivorans]